MLILICTKQVGAAFVADLTSGKEGHQSGAAERLAEIISSMQATSTDRPEATNVIADQEGCGYIGHVKLFNPLKGYGMISCDETHQVYKRDIFVQQSKLPAGGGHIGRPEGDLGRNKS